MSKIHKAMKFTKEPKEVDFLIKSENWSKEDLADFRKLMREIKRRNKVEGNFVIKEIVKINKTRKAT